MGRSGEIIRFAGTHLKAKAGEENEKLRELHIEQMLGHLSNCEPAHVVLCGDFNTDPFDVEHHKARAVPAVLGHDMGFCSAYPLPASAEDAGYTTWKRRKEREDRHVIDYIFHTPGLQPGAVWEVPAAADMCRERLPNRKYPSDHVAIAAELTFI